MKNEKICWRYHHFAHVHQKSQSYDVRFLRYWVRQTKSFIILGYILPFHLSSPLMITNINILMKMKKIPGDIILLYIHVCHKWRSFNIWFLKYKEQQTEIFDILGHFFNHSASWQTKKIKVLTLKKKNTEILSFYTFAP